MGLGPVVPNEWSSVWYSSSKAAIWALVGSEPPIKVWRLFDGLIPPVIGVPIVDDSIGVGGFSPPTPHQVDGSPMEN
ncbi:hypothetical protein RRF57_008690 [Xylaria bambusicola]|uniref:Uncharacterized protein n=1 Tax=Xylaria bambusicola TaxID=326684 RepID=A0AAN7ZB90_9PEZI